MAGYREFQTGEVLTSANVNDFLMNQAVMVFADSSARNTALGTAVGGSNALLEGMLSYNKGAGRLEVYDGTTWKVVGVAEIDPIVATGGDEVYEFVDGGIVYKAHLFENSGNFVVSSAPGGTATAEVLLAAGGGGGGGMTSGANAYYYSGGGGAGGLLVRTVSVTATTYAIVVGSGGAGGAAGSNNGTSGQNSTGFSLTAVGGGYGAYSVNGGGGGDGGSGGSGGGGSDGRGGVGTAGQGHHGGGGQATLAGSGGGAGGGGGNGEAFNAGPRANNGVVTGFFGREQVVCEGGPAGTYTNEPSFDGLGYGSGGGGAGAKQTTPARAGGDGQDGVVVVRYPVRYV